MPDFLNSTSVPRLRRARVFRPGFTPALESGFTLVELLVVIGIVAVLIALLLPALSRARMQQQTVHCMGNIRQSGMAMLMYANDNGGVVPPQHAGYVAVTDPDSWVYKVRPYLQSYEVLTCTNAQPFFWGYDESLPAMSYFANGLVCGSVYAGGKPAMKLSRARRSSECMLLMDHAPLMNGSWVTFVAETGVYGSDWWYPHPRYDLGGPPGQYRNVCFADGHAETVLRDTMQQWQFDWAAQ